MRAHDVKRLPGLNFISIPLGMLLLIYPLLWIWQGLDLTDTGFWLSNYSLIFTHPESVSSGFLCYLSEILGGAWLLLWGDSGLIAARFGYVFVLYLTMAAAFYALKDEFRPVHLLFSLCLAIVFIIRQDLMIIGYNNLSALFYTLTGALLYKGVKEKRSMLLFVAGGTAVLNIFIRFPNLLGLLLFLAPLLACPKKERKAAIKHLRLSLCGGLAAFGLVFVFMGAFGHLHIYLKELAGLTDFLQQEGAQHSGASLFSMFIKDHRSTFNHGIFICAIYALAAALFLPLRKYQNNLVVKIAAIVPGIAAGVCVFWYAAWIESLAAPVLAPGRWTYTGVLYLLLIAAWLGWGRQDPGKRLLIFISLAILVLAPLGSGNGIKNSVFGMWLAFPLAACYIVEKSAWNPATAALFTIVLIFGVTSVWSYTYRDSKNRLEMVYSVNHPKLKGIRTTQERAAAVEALLKRLPAYVDPGDQLLAVESIPLLHFLTETRPVLKSAWPLNLTPGMLERRMRAVRKTKNSLPTIVKAALNTRAHDWPENQDEGLFAGNPALFKKRAVISGFVESKGYQKAWENEGFEIWTPKHSGFSEPFYRFDYAMDDFVRICCQLKPVMEIDWQQLGGDQVMSLQHFRQKAYPFAAIQGKRGVFEFKAKTDEKGMRVIRIRPESDQSDTDQLVLQLGPWAKKTRIKHTVQPGSLAVCRIRARCVSNQPERGATVFIQDKVEKWEKQTGAKMVFGNGKWQELVVFKKIRPDPEAILAGINWRPAAESEYIEIEAMELFICNRKSVAID